MPGTRNKADACMGAWASCQPRLGKLMLLCVCLGQGPDMADADEFGEGEQGDGQ